MADPQEKMNSSTEKGVTTEITSGRDTSPVDIRRMSTDSAAAAKKILEHSGDHDEAMKAFANGEDVEVDEATNKRLLRRIDLHMMPLMCVVYGLNVSSTDVYSNEAHQVQYLDKTTLSYASIMGLKEDIGLVGDNYQWLGAKFSTQAESHPNSSYRIDLLFWISCMGVSYESFDAAMALGEVQCVQRDHMGLHSGASRSGRQLRRSCCRKTVSRCFRGGCDARLRPFEYVKGPIVVSGDQTDMYKASQWYTRQEQGFRTCIW